MNEEVKLKSSIRRRLAATCRKEIREQTKRNESEVIGEGKGSKGQTRSMRPLRLPLFLANKLVGKEMSDQKERQSSWLGHVFRVKRWQIINWKTSCSAIKRWMYTNTHLFRVIRKSVTVRALFLAPKFGQYFSYLVDNLQINCVSSGYFEANEMNVKCSFFFAFE